MSHSRQKDNMGKKEYNLKWLLIDELHIYNVHFTKSKQFVHSLSKILASPPPPFF